MNFFSFFLYFTSKAKKCYSKNVKGRVFGVYLFSYANNGMVQTSLRSPAVHWDRFCLITLTTIQLTLFSFILCNVLDYWYIWLFSFFSKPHIFYFLLHCHGLSVQDYLCLCRREFVIWLSIMTLRASWLYIFFFFKNMRSYFNTHCVVSQKCFILQLRVLFGCASSLLPAQWIKTGYTLYL